MDTGTPMDIESLNAAFGIPDRLSFVEAPGSLVQARVRKSHKAAIFKAFPSFSTNILLSGWRRWP